MILYFADRGMNIIATASTELPKGLVIVNDKKVDNVEVGVVTLEFDLTYKADEQADAEAATTPGNYILRSNGDEREYYTILDSDGDTDSNSISVYAEGAGLDLINEIATEYEATEAHPAAWYIEKFAYDSGFEIGLNEISNLSRKLSWDGESTVTERLLSVATQFEAEISFSFDISGMKLLHKYINLHKKRRNNTGIDLRRGREVGRIRTKRSVANLATALKVTGGTPDDADKPITLSGYQYDDSDFFVEGTYLKSREAVKIWSRYRSELGDYTGHIMRTFTYDTTSQSELCNRAISELKRICKMEVNYEVELLTLPNNIKTGDTVNIVDYTGDLYLSARVLMIEVSASNKTQKATLGDFLMTGGNNLE